MTDPNLVILYVTDVAASLAFWSDLLGRPPVERSDTFAMLPLRDGVMLGLWKIDGVEPTTRVTGGGAEIAFAVVTRDEVDRLHTNWSESGRTILQPPADMDFGRTFSAADPDGHRLRVYCPAG
ncbi:VOC family protein [Pinisolibacter sp.]|uniref:VOC family protein n=1 Tax=Pinisolibacter sp. TaxID=2172024 RepID=UPI002FDF02E0